MRFFYIYRDCCQYLSDLRFVKEANIYLVMLVVYSEWLVSSFVVTFG